MAKNENMNAKIIARAWKDPRFKEKLLKNPKAALKEVGWDVPENFDVRVIEEKSNSITLSLPKAPAEAHELSDQELQKLAGGADCRRHGTGYVFPILPNEGGWNFRP